MNRVERECRMAWIKILIIIALIQFISFPYWWSKCSLGPHKRWFYYYLLGCCVGSGLDRQPAVHQSWYDDTLACIRRVFLLLLLSVCVCYRKVNSTRIEKQLILIPLIPLWRIQVSFRVYREFIENKLVWWAIRVGLVVVVVSLYFMRYQIGD